ncbi:MAG: hypothetical protein CMP34_01035 [Rickettsiales bacterium]|nr:hypothetical protein [Rickettsiales bacterium]
MLKKNYYKESIIFFSCGILILFFFPNFFSEIEPDSYQYIYNNSNRKSLYPMFIDIFGIEKDGNYFWVIFLQHLILNFSVVYLMSTLHNFNLSIFMKILFFIFLFLNIYYISFPATILTESLFFSVVNFSTGLSIKVIYEKNKSFFSLGLLLGLILSLKSIGIILSLSFIFFIFYLTKLNKKKIIFLLFGLLVFPTIERFYHGKYSIGSKGDSVLYQSFLGKIFMISGQKDFEKSVFIDKDDNLIKDLIKQSSSVNKFLDEIKNPYLFLDLHADYEVIAQYQILEINDQNREEIRNLFFRILEKYPTQFLKLSLNHYLGLWFPGGKQIFLNEYLYENQNVQLPLKEELNNVSGSTLGISKMLLLLNLIFFNILLLSFTLITINSLVNLYKRKIDLIDAFVIIIQIYLIAVSFTNISTPRYFMPIYPLTLLIVFSKFRNYSRNFI